jgi:predicted phage terminase large subunit-like protein
MLTNELINELLKSPLEFAMLLKTNLKLYIKVFHYYLAKDNFIFKDFHNEIITSIENIVYDRAEKQNLAIAISPRCGKSLIVKYAISWFYTVNKNCNNIYTSYSDKLIMKFSGDIRDIIESDLYFKLFGIILKKDTSAKSLWQIDKGGQLVASAMGGSITGFGAGLSGGDFGGALVIDDPMKADDFKSETERQNVIDFYTGTLKTRLNNTEKTPTILIMQRLHEDDLIGYLEKIEPENWKFIKVPAIDSEGNSIFPEKLTLNYLEQIKRTTPFTFFSQYQQAPIKIGGNIIKSEWFKEYETLPKLKEVFIVCDTATKKGTGNDYTVFQCWGKTQDNDFYLIDELRGKYEVPELIGLLTNFYEKHKYYENKKVVCRCVYIEDKSSGTGLIQQLKRSRIPVKELVAEKDKFQRVCDILPIIEAGYVYIPRIADFKLDFLGECEAFTADNSHKHDDQIDCLSYALSHQITSKTNGLVGWN